VVPGQTLHLIQRGVNRAVCFSSDEDRQVYKQTLRAASVRAGCAIHAYVLMTNHVHLLATASDERSPARMMHFLGSGYVRYFNARHDRTGTLWEGRYKSALIDSEHYLLACSLYIESNPVRAGMVAHPGLYAWSSFRCNARGEGDVLVTPHRVYAGLGAEAPSRLAAYRALFSAPTEPDVLDAIRHATNAGAVLGSTHCREAFEHALNRPLGRPAHGGDRRSSAVTPSAVPAERADDRSSTSLAP
jgi:putative transposase